MSEVAAYAGLLSALDVLEEIATRQKAERDLAITLLRECCPDNPKVRAFLDRLKSEVH